MKTVFRSCPKCNSFRVVILPIPENELNKNSVRAQCLSCGSHTDTVDSLSAGSLRAAYITALTLWNERKVSIR